MYLEKTPEQLNRFYEEIVAFSELGEFIDRPIKTYSAGMSMRLAFSLATCLNPDILLIDEILGVGDAYYRRKCVDRLRSMMDHGATAVIVAHDLSAIQSLCMRLLWIDEGRIIMDGAPLEVLKAYSASIRRQEERRLRSAFSSASPQASRTRADERCNHGKVRITAVQVLNKQEEEQHIFDLGEPFSIRIHYCADDPVIDPAFVVAIYLSDGLVIYHAISSRDHIRFGELAGNGVVDILFQDPLLGSGHYVFSVGIYPRVDLWDKLGEPPYDLHSRVYELKIESPMDCAINLGIVRQSVSWVHHRSK